MASWRLRTAGAAISSIPLAGAALQYSLFAKPILWPPIGGVEIYAAPLATALVAVFGAIPAWSKGKAATRIWLAVSIFLVLLSLIAYVYLLSTFVKEIETPDNGTQYRTIGSQRTAKAIRLFPDKSDGQILKIAGLEEDDIENMWTISSIREVRSELFFSYLLGLCSINFILGLIAHRKTQKDARGPEGPSAGVSG
jgi:membrane protein implicated in regulation of membrane protease activity